MEQAVKKELTSFHKEAPKKPKAATGVEAFMVYYSYNVIDKKTKRVLDKAHDKCRVMMSKCYNRGDQILRKDLERLVYDMVDNDHFVKTNNRGQKDRTKQQRTYDVVIEVHGFHRMNPKVVSLVPRLNLDPQVQAQMEKRNRGIINHNLAQLWSTTLQYAGKKFRGERYNYYSEHTLATLG